MREQPLPLAEAASLVQIAGGIAMRIVGRPTPHLVRPGQESVWDYPRPPRLEPVSKRVRVVFDGLMVADTTAAWRVLETSHPPSYYLPAAAIAPGTLERAEGTSLCEWKGAATYWDVVGPRHRGRRAAWSYARPAAGFEPIAGHVAFYPAAMEACYVAEDRVTPQPGGFYGGWITPELAGPFKGEPGTMGW